MEKQSQLACKVANKVALAMVYADTTGHPGSSRGMISEGLNETCELLEQINPSELRDWYTQFHEVHQQTYQQLIDDPAIWSAFVGSRCDLFQNVGLHQKTIELVGNDLANWDRLPVSFDSFAMGLDGMVSLITDQSKALMDAIERQSGHATNTQRRSSLFANSVCGLAICFIAINEAIELKSQRDSNCAGLANFGAYMTSSCIRRLSQVCKLEQPS